MALKPFIFSLCALSLGLMACAISTRRALPPAATPPPRATVASPGDGEMATPGTSEAVSPTESASPLETMGPPRVDVPLVSDAVYGEDNGMRFARIPTDDCANLTATPVVVGGWLVYPMHTARRCRQNVGSYDRVLLGYHMGEGKLYLLRQGEAGEAPLLYDPTGGTLYWNVTFGGTTILLEPRTFELRRKVSVGITADSAGTVLDGLYYFGTVNGPDPACQQPLNPKCGSLFALDAEGNVVYQRTTPDGFRAWIGTSATTDGQFLYFGSAAQTVGQKSGDETEYLYGCSVIKTDTSLTILASFDPGDLACYKLPFEGANEDSVSGEVVPDGSGLWVQYVRPNDGRMKSALYRLDLDLKEQCRVEFDFEPKSQAAGFYAGPTVDAQGNAYIAVTVPDSQAGRRGLLVRVTPTCQATTLAQVPGSFAQASPTLADDQYVLFATDGRLGVYNLEGELVREYSLASQARVLAGPVIHEGVLYVVQEDATLNVIDDSGLEGYGSAIWPRYRRDNIGSASLGR